MLAYLPEHKLACVLAPKCMTTTLGLVFYEVRFARPYSHDENDGRPMHRVWRDLCESRGLGGDPPDVKLLSGYSIFSVVRDPIERLLSAYKNRVIAKGEMKKAWEWPAWRRQNKGKFEDLTPLPDAETFFLNLQRYRALVASVRHHTDPIVSFIGEDLSPFDRVFHMDDVEALEEYLREKLGYSIALPHAQRSGGRDTPLSLGSLSGEAVDVIQAHTAQDYKVLKDYFVLEGGMAHVKIASE